MRTTPLIYLKIGAVVLIVLGLVFYAYHQSREYLNGPVIEITSPRNGSTVTDSYVEIVGHAKNITFISLNDREITTDTDGNFKEPLLLPEGYTIMTLRARDRWKRERVETLELVYKPSGTTSPKTVL